VLRCTGAEQVQRCRADAKQVQSRCRAGAEGVHRWFRFRDGAKVQEQVQMQVIVQVLVQRWVQR
jgi:hypothetical protein